jgi:hypothetical protein
MPTFTWKDNAAYKWHNRTSYIWHDVTIMASYVIACLCFAAKHPEAAMSALKPVLSFAASLATMSFTAIQNVAYASISTLFPTVSFSHAGPAASFSGVLPGASFERLRALGAMTQGKAAISLSSMKPGYSITNKKPTITFTVETRNGCNCA